MRALLTVKRSFGTTLWSKPTLTNPCFLHKRFLHKRSFGKNINNLVFYIYKPSFAILSLSIASMDLEYNSDHQVLVCKSCQTCVRPSQKSVEKHLRSKPHRLIGQSLKSYLNYSNSLELRSLESLQQKKPIGRILALKYLKI